MNLFDEKEHKYYIDGKEVPGVTSVIKENNLSRFFGTEEHLERGSHIHLLTELWDKDNLDMDSVSKDYLMRLVAWANFCSEFKLEHIHTELPVFSKKYRFGGKLDRLSFAKVKRTKELWLIDLKSGVPSAAVDIQTSGYEIAATEQLGLKCPLKRIAVHLKSDGTYNIYHCENQKNLFLYAVALTHYRWQNGLKNE